MRARYRNTLTPADVGQRVSIRRWIEDEERGARPSDVIGHLTSWDDGVLLVARPAKGERPEDVVEVYEADILAAKVIPPAPVRPVRPAPEGFEG